ncbi:M16 family metallopeptidase [Breznakiella homolactica]|uniref:Insulinase family protein n=1 Tax=Breznakiella homolactica TaxID=2798577 RepID=A0A7T7XPQ1_9SPIR|nr:M16 family metallopeptidase [Breznakiella homolactica]QQO10244.1 insulinase family protein [Breznakiella homolactica]
MYRNKKKHLLNNFVFAAVLTAAVFGVFACASGAKTGSDQYGGLGKASDPMPFMTEARTGTLPNGLRYYILENSRPENRAYLTLAVNAGSVLEEENERGLAHFVEHMAFNGTTRFPEADLINYLRSLGMRFGPEVNAYTSYDETVYGIEVPVELDAAGRKTIPEKALAVIDDWTYAITFDPKDVDDERLVIMEEYRTRLGANERVRRQMLPVLFEGSPYADRMPIGLPEVIQNAPASRLEGFYKKWYRADNMALVFVGDFDGAALEASLAANFTAPSPADTLDRPYYDLPSPQKGKFRAEIITDPELSYTRIDMYYKRAPQPVENTLAAYRQGIIENLISRMLSLRFDEASYKQETPYAAAAAGSVRYGWSSRFYIFSVVSKTGTAEASLEAVLREKESMVRYGFTDDEIDRAKRSMLSDLERMVSEKDRQQSSSFVDEFTSHFLSDQAVVDIEWELDAVRRILPGISSKEITAAAKNFFAADDLTVFAVAPDSEAASLPSPEKIQTMVTQVRKAKIDPPQPSVIGTDLLDKKPSPGTIISERQDPATGTIVWELSNGSRVILKETANKNDEIVLYSLARGGTTSSPESEDVSASLAADMLSVSGMGPYSRTDLTKMLADKQVSVGFWLSSYLRGFQGMAAGKDAETLFELLYLRFTQPRIDEDAVGAMMDQYRTSLAQRSENPEAVFNDEIQRVVYGGNSRFAPLTLGDLEKASIDDAFGFIRKSLNPGDYTFVFIGNLDIPLFRSLTETYIASIPRGQTWDQWDTVDFKRPGKTESAVRKGREEKSIVFMGWYVPKVYTEREGIVAGALSEYLDIRLTEEIREKLGGVYSVSVSVSLTPIPVGELSMGVSFYCDPGRADELSAAIEAELRLVADGSINTDTLIKTTEAMKKTYEQSMQSNSYIARNYANFSVLLDLPFGRLDARPELYESVTAADIQKTARELLSGGPARVTLYPEGR